MTPAGIPPGWIEAARQGFVDAWRLMADTLPGGASTEHDGLALAATGLRLSGCNTAMAVGRPADPEAALQFAARFFGERDLPWVLFATGEAVDALVPHTAAAGLRISYSEPAMFLLPEDARRPVPVPGFSIEVVADEAAMDRYRQTAAAGFEMDALGFTIWANADLIDTAGLHFYLGLLDEQPVATSCVYALHGIATINMVSTVPAYRRRGIGELMTWRAIEDGFHLDCHAAFLHASQMGYSVYKDMGFRHTFTYQTWTTQQI